MATRSRPARSQATTRPKRTTARRKPAARRKPGARRNGSRIRWDRVGRVALTLVLAAVLYSYLNPAIDFVKTYTATTAAKAEFHELLRENKRLHRRIQTADEPVVVDRRARAQGLVAEGETPIVVHNLGG
jgi:cell division protein FtsB